MLPREDVNQIKLQINNGILGTAQYEFICLRLIDTIKQLEEKINLYEDLALEHHYQLILDEME